MSVQIIALCNQKGDVGKSTTTFHLARAAVLSGKRVLVVDNDPQGNLTSVSAADVVEDEQAGLADVLSARGPLSYPHATISNYTDETVFAQPRSESP